MKRKCKTNTTWGIS